MTDFNVRSYGCCVENEMKKGEEGCKKTRKRIGRILSQQYRHEMSWSKEKALGKSLKIFKRYKV